MMLVSKMHLKKHLEEKALGRRARRMSNPIPRLFQSGTALGAIVPT
jgi:hypothetical protein